MGYPDIHIFEKEFGPCSKGRVLRALQKAKDDLLAGAHDESSDYVQWVEEAMRTASSLEGEELVKSGMPTSTPSPARLEVAVILDAYTLDANTDETNVTGEALSLYTTLIDQWRDKKQEICNIPFRTPIPEGEEDKYPESVLVVDNPEPYEPDRIPYLKMVALDSFDQRESPVIISVRVNIVDVIGPSYSETGTGPPTFRAFGSRTSGFVELSVPASGLQPVRFTGATEPVFPSSVNCPFSPAHCIARLVGSGGGDDFINQLLEEGLDLELEKAVRATVECQ